MNCEGAAFTRNNFNLCEDYLLFKWGFLVFLGRFLWFPIRNSHLIKFVEYVDRYTVMFHLYLISYLPCYYVTNRKVAGSRPDEENDFYQVT
jgi:hypothetical protein